MNLQDIGLVRVARHQSPRVSLTQWDGLAYFDLSVRSPEMLLDLTLDAVSTIPVVDMRKFPGFDIEGS
jgi:hypothetical protein